MSPIGNSTLTLALLFLLTLQSNAKCQKYLDSAKEAAGALQSKYWNGVDYGSVQPIWISGADAFYLNTRTLQIHLLCTSPVLILGNS